MATKQQIVCHLLVLLLSEGIYSIRAQQASSQQLDSQEDIGALDDPPQFEYRQFLNALQYNPPRSLDESPDTASSAFAPMDRHTMNRILRSPLPAYPPAPHHMVRYPSAQVMETANMSPGIKRFYEMYRMPDVKRQARYRQCYFNPVACFK